MPGGGEVIYVDTGGGPGTMVEILKPAPGGRDEGFAHLPPAGIVGIDVEGELERGLGLVDQLQ